MTSPTRARLRTATAVVSAGAIVVLTTAFRAAPADVAHSTAKHKHPAVKIGGLDTSGFASPLSILIYEPEIPIPSSPQGEIRYAYSEATLSSGPFATALASSVYPGPTLTNGLQQFNSHAPAYPVVTRAAYPGSKAGRSTTKSYGPATMSAKAGPNMSTSSATSGASPIAALAKIGSASSTTTMRHLAHSVVSTSVARVNDVSLLGGIIKLSNAIGTTTASSTAKSAKASGSETAAGLTVAGQKFTIDDKGVHGPKSIKVVSGLLGKLVPGIPTTGNKLLERFGIKFTLPLVHKHAKGHTGKAAGQGLLISIDTTPFKKAISAVPLQKLIKMTPNICLPDNSGTQQLPFGECLQDNLDAVLNLSPRIDFLFTNTASAANAVKLIPFHLPPAPTSPTTPTTPQTGPTGTGPTGSLSSPGGGSVPTTGGSNPSPVTPTQPQANVAPNFFTGLGAKLLFLGFLAALAAALLFRWLGMPLMGGALGRCDRGAPGGAPALRGG
jgi:hypothetical protein